MANIVEVNGTFVNLDQLLYTELMGDGNILRLYFATSQMSNSNKALEMSGISSLTHLDFYDEAAKVMTHFLKSESKDAAELYKAEEEFNKRGNQLHL